MQVPKKKIKNCYKKKLKVENVSQIKIETFKKTNKFL